MMELGATLCTPQSPQCLLCPVTQFCQARKLGIAGSLPARRKKRATEVITLAAAVLLDTRGRTLLLPPPKLSRHTVSRRAALLSESPPGVALAQGEIDLLVSKLWHFPTIAVQTNPAAELKEHLDGLFRTFMARQSLQLEALPTARHAVTYRAITLRPFRVIVAQLPRIPNAKTISLAEIISPSSLAISNLTRKAARAALASAAAFSARA
jgi:adenine-specific DNA glycosylase